MCQIFCVTNGIILKCLFKRVNIFTLLSHDPILVDYNLSMRKTGLNEYVFGGKKRQWKRVIRNSLMNVV